MTDRVLPLVRWNTSSLATAGAAAARDLSSLGAHYENCNGCKGRWFTLRCAAEAVHSFVAPRFVTTLVVVGAVLATLAVAL